MTQAVQYNVRDNQGNVYGPATTDMLRAWVREGRIVAGMAIAPEGTEGWTEVSVHPSLSDLFGGATINTAANPVVEATPASAYSSAVASSPSTPIESAPTAEATNTPVVRAPADVGTMGYQSPVSLRSNTLALVSFIVGILAILSTITVCCCYGVLNGPLGLGAIVTGFLAMTQMKKQPGEFSNNWMAMTGLILGAVAVLAAMGSWVVLIISLIMNHS